MGPSPRTLLLLPLLALLGCAGSKPAPASTAPTVVLLVRHAEKEQAQGDDPALTPGGEARARTLAAVLKDAGVQAVYATPYRRTQQTAAPLAAQRGLQVQVRDAGEAQAATFVRELLHTHAGSTVLVVGHSNTLPALAEALTGVRLPPVPDDRYDLLLVATLPAAGPAQLLTLHYGEPRAP